MRLALLGAGGIATDVAWAIESNTIEGVELVGVAGSTPGSPRARALAGRFGLPNVVAEELVELRPDWVLEAAGRQAVRDYSPRLLAAGVNLIVMSVGALLDDELAASIQRHRNGATRIVVPSGAIGGLDAVRALNATGGLHSAAIKTTKSRAGLMGAPYLMEHGIELPVDEVYTVFRGSALEAVKGFPANINVAAALSLCGLGPSRTGVTIVSDPHTVRTTHEIQAEGEAGVVHVRVETSPSTSNPRTSHLAALSAIAAVRDVLSIPACAAT